MSRALCGQTAAMERRSGASPGGRGDAMSDARGDRVIPQATPGGQGDATSDARRCNHYNIGSFMMPKNLVCSTK